MAVYDAAKVRAVGIELKERVLELYADLLPIQTTLSGWSLNGIDPALPTPFEVRVQLEAYDALTKSALRLTEWISALKQAQPADYISYPPPPTYFDGSHIFDGGGTPDP